MRKVENAPFAASLAFAVEMKIIQHGMETAQRRQYRLLEEMDMIVFPKKQVTKPL